MRRISLSQEAFNQAKAEYLGADHGEKKAVLERWAVKAKCSQGGLRNAIADGYVARPKRHEFTAEKQDLLNKAAAFIESSITSPKSTRVALKHVVNVLEQAGRIPKGAIKKRELSAYLKQHRVGHRHRVTRRYRRTKPNGMHQMDFSVSRVLKAYGDGAVQVRSNFVYENRPDTSRLRVWIGSVVDNASGVGYAQYFLSPGESADIAIKFIRAAWESKPDFPLWGVPDAIYLDQGPWTKRDMVTKLFAKLNVQHIKATQYSPWVKGQVEARFRPFKEELEALILGKLARGTILSLDKANSMLRGYCKSLSLRPHASGSGTKLEYWREHVAELWFPENFDELAYDTFWGTVRRGRITHQHADYYVPPHVADGTRLEIIKLEGRLWIFIPGTARTTHKLLELTEALLNTPPPVDPESVRARKTIAEGSKKFEPFSLEEADQIIGSRLPADVDFTPPPATSHRRVQGAGTQLLGEEAQREMLFNVLGPLNELPEEILNTYVIRFCCHPHSTEEINTQARRIRLALERSERVEADIEEILKEQP